MATPHSPAAATLSPGQQVTVFLIIAFALPWLLRLTVGLGTVKVGGMLAVGLATLVALHWPRRQPTILRETGIVPVRPFGPLLRWSAVALGLITALAVLAILIGAAAGTSPLDLDGFSGLRLMYGTDERDPLTVMALAFGQSVALFVVVLPLAFCEEWGWRGLLLPRLLGLGAWPALVLSGLIWGLWHLPGFVGPGADSGLVPFVVFAVGFGILLGWVRMASRSIWPVTLTHAAYNTLIIGFVNVALVDAEPIEHPDPWAFGLLGWPGWICFGSLTVFLILGGRMTRTVREFRTSARELPDQPTAH